MEEQGRDRAMSTGLIYNPDLYNPFRYISIRTKKVGVAQWWRRASPNAVRAGRVLFGTNTVRVDRKGEGLHFCSTFLFLKIFLVYFNFIPFNNFRDEI
jgi:hypothetical protein